MKKKLIKEMEFFFGKDRQRIEHAHNVLKYAEEILNAIVIVKSECDNINKLVVVSSAILHDIGIHACEKKYGLTSGNLQEKEGPPIARHIMEKLGIDENIIKEVCSIIGSHHSPGEINTLNFKILYDADWLVNLNNKCDSNNKEKLKKLIDKIFLTDAGKKIAKRVYGVI